MIPIFSRNSRVSSTSEGRLEGKREGGRRREGEGSEGGREKGRGGEGKKERGKREGQGEKREKGDNKRRGTFHGTRNNLILGPLISFRHILQALILMWL